MIKRKIIIEGCDGAWPRIIIKSRGRKL